LNVVDMFDLCDSNGMDMVPLIEDEKKTKLRLLHLSKTTVHVSNA